MSRLSSEGESPLIRKNLGVLAIAGLFAFSMVYVYAEQQVLVELPIDRPFAFDNCIGFHNSGSFSWSCIWTWSISPEIEEQIQREPFASSADHEIWLQEILPLVEANPLPRADTIDEESITDETVDEPEPTPFETLDPEVRKALDKLGVCQFGDGVWSGIVANYTREVPDELPIFTSGLDKKPLLGKLAKSFEECKGKTNYPWLSQQYEDVYLADLIGLDRFDRPELSFGLDERRLYEEQRTATPEEKQAEADRVVYPDWYINPYEELTGENRGNPEPIISDHEAYNEYISDLAASIQTPADTERAYRNALIAMCDTYQMQYDYKIKRYIENGQNVTDTSNYPEWLLHCLD